MEKASKKDQDKLPLELRQAIAENLEYYISHAKPPLNDEREVAKAAGLHPKTIQRLRLPGSHPKAGTGLGTLVRLAKVLGIDVSLLLRRGMLSGKELPQQETAKHSFKQLTKKGLRE